MRYRARKGIVGSSVLVAGVALIVSLCLPTSVSAQATPSATGSRATLDQFCVTCHNQRLETAGLRLDELDVSDPSQHAEVWEKVVQKLRSRTMPPAERHRAGVRHR